MRREIKKSTGGSAGSYVVWVFWLFVFPADCWLCIFSAYLTSGWLSSCRNYNIRAAVLLTPISLQLDGVG